MRFEKINKSSHRSTDSSKTVRSIIPADGDRSCDADVAHHELYRLLRRLTTMLWHRVKDGGRARAARLRSDHRIGIVSNARCTARSRENGVNPRCAPPSLQE